MIQRVAGFLTLLLMGGCAAPVTQLPACWQADSFEDGQRLVGSVTLLLAQGDELVPSSAMMTPLACESGSFKIDNPSDFQLMRFAHPFREGDELFGTAINATIAGVVRVDHSKERLSRGPTPYRITLSSVRDLKPVKRPAWWRS